MNILVLGGTTEGSAIARALAEDVRFSPVLSLAGRTRSPVLPAVPGRRGGFGGVDGLAAFLHAERIGALVDATHPFAQQMHRHAAAAAQRAGVPRVTVLRPAWSPQPGDRWTEIETMAEAAEALGPAPRRVFLTIGQKELAPFQDAPWHDYLVRSVEPPDRRTLPPGIRCITARGPFTRDDEFDLLVRERISIIVSKNSGGTATDAKLLAARDLCLPVLLIRRPTPPEPPLVPDAAGALAWLDHLVSTGTVRGV